MLMTIKLNIRQKSDYGWQLFLSGFFMYLFGFFLWNVDNKMCQSLKTIRSNLNPGLTPITQLHGWWHILAGYATHIHIQSCIFHRQIFLKDEIKFRMTWVGIEATRKDIKEKIK